jgi:hypothetical protein
MDALAELLDLQCGVVSRRQAHECGLEPWDLKRLLRRRELVRLHDGVYLDHTGVPTWLQRAWGAVLFAWPAALCGISAIRATQGPGMRGHDDSTAPIHVAVDRNRRFVAPPGVVAHRLKDLDDRALWNLGPPRLRTEEAVLDVAASADDDFAAVEALASAVRSRLTTVDRLCRALARRSRIARRSFLTAVLRDLAAGACSTLERSYLTRVERPHGLSSARRQVRASARGPIYRDVEYEKRVVIELDGRLDHTRLKDRDRDLDRDLQAAIEHKVTARLGWGQVVGRPCVTAREVHRLLTAYGVVSPFRPCPDCVRHGRR